MAFPKNISLSVPITTTETQTSSQQEIRVNMVDHHIRQIGDIGMALTATGIINYSKDWDYKIGLPTLFGSIAIITNFYYTHEFRSEREYNLSNIAKISLLTIGLISFNTIWFNRSLPNVDICERHPDLWACK